MIKATIDAYEWAQQTTYQTTLWLAALGFNPEFERWPIEVLPEGDIPLDKTTYFVDEMRGTVTYVQAY